MSKRKIGMEQGHFRLLHILDIPDDSRIDVDGSDFLDCPEPKPRASSRITDLPKWRRRV
jgi:hypothetical protein